MNGLYNKLFVGKSAAWTAIFTGVLTVASIYQFSVLNGQLNVMRNDERAWVAISSGSFGFTQPDPSGNIFIYAPVLITNTGKTPARQSVTSVVVDIVKNGEQPKLTYVNVPQTEDFVGAILPNAPEKMFPSVLGFSPKGRYEARPISAAEIQDLKDGKSFLVTYGQTTYTDIFGKVHWHHYCSYASLLPGSTVTAVNCSQYNDVDKN